MNDKLTGCSSVAERFVNRRRVNGCCEKSEGQQQKSSSMRHRRGGFPTPHVTVPSTVGLKKSVANHRLTDPKACAKI